MAFIIDRNLLKTINRQTAEHLRLRDANMKDVRDTTVMTRRPENARSEVDAHALAKNTRRVAHAAAEALKTTPATQFSRADIRNALMLAKKHTTSSAVSLLTTEEHVEVQSREIPAYRK